MNDRNSLNDEFLKNQCMPDIQQLRNLAEPSCLQPLING